MSSSAAAPGLPLRLKVRGLFAAPKQREIARSTSHESVSSEPITEALLDEVVQSQDVPKESELTSGPSSEPTTEALIERIQREDRDAFAILFRRYWRLILSIGCKVLGTHSEAEDLVQDVFLYIWTKSKSLKLHNGHSMHQFVVRIIYHRAFDRRRYLMSRLYWHPENGNQKRIDAIPQRNSRMWNLDGQIHMRRVLESAFTRLSEQQKNILLLYYFEGLSLREITEKTNEKFHNVKNHWARGIQRLRESVYIDDWHGD